MPSHAGRHELGQNFLHDQTVISDIVDLVAHTTGPIVEFGAGDGALTLAVERLHRPVTAIEIDARRARRLARRVGPQTDVVAGDFLRHRPPAVPHVVVGNLPFHQTTATLRHLLYGAGWTDAILLVQWEVARRRAAVGGATMMTAQWWPWFDFDVHGRVPAAAFRPRPGVDGGLLTMTRRAHERVPTAERKSYQAMVHRVFTGRGRDLPNILTRSYGRGAARNWLRHNTISHGALPRELTAEQWASLFATVGRNR